MRFATKLLADKTRLLDWLQACEPSADRQAALDAATTLSAQLRSQASTGRHSILAPMFPKIILGADAIRFEIDVSSLIRKLVTNDGMSDATEQDLESAASFETLTLPIQMKRRGNEMRMIVDGTDHHANPDPSLVALIAKAHFYLARLIEEPQLSITDLADRFGVDRVDVGRTLSLAFLAPRLTDQILTGNQPIDLSARYLAGSILP